MAEFGWANSIPSKQSEHILKWKRMWRVKCGIQFSSSFVVGFALIEINERTITQFKT